MPFMSRVPRPPLVISGMAFQFVDATLTKYEEIDCRRQARLHALAGTALLARIAFLP